MRAPPIVLVVLLLLGVALLPQSSAFSSRKVVPRGVTPSSSSSSSSRFPTTCTLLFSSSQPPQQQQQQPSSPAAAASATPTELPDSLDDGAHMAAQACRGLIEANAGVASRCRVDFDTSAGDETFSVLKQSTEFMQKFVTSLVYLQMPQLQHERQQEMMRVVQAQQELQQLLDDDQQNDDDDNDNDTKNNDNADQKVAELQTMIANHGRAPDDSYQGPMCRIYFPDEGSAALARRDWLSPPNGGPPLVPPCVQMAACGSVQQYSVDQDQLVFFFCPKASESGAVEELLQQTETTSRNLQLTVLVNPNLVDMGVTGFGMAGRLLRERLIDPLPHAYYLRTLQWGALTRVWPQLFSVWQEDDDAQGGYRLIRALPTLPSNPEVEDIYDVENNNSGRDTNGDGNGGGGMLDQLGDFVNGMMRL